MIEIELRDSIELGIDLDIWLEIGDSRIINQQSNVNLLSLYAFVKYVNFTILEFNFDDRITTDELQLFTRAKFIITTHLRIQLSYDWTQLPGEPAIASWFRKLARAGKTCRSVREDSGAIPRLPIPFVAIVPRDIVAASPSFR